MRVRCVIIGSSQPKKKKGESYYNGGGSQVDKEKWERGAPHTRDLHVHREEKQRERRASYVN
jgi:hypothetical protein